jgi:uncharacterized protein involved in exopolysaccharide biosynthesis
LAPEIVPLSDLWHFFLRSKKLFIRIALIGACLGFCGAIYRGAFYEVQARFSDGGSSTPATGLDLMMRSLLQSSATDTQHDSVAVAAHSHRFLRPFISAMGLQVKVLPESHPWIARVADLLCNLWRAEWALPLSSTEQLRFRDVLYEGNVSLTLYLERIASDRYRLFSTDRTSWLEAEVGEAVQMADCSLTVERLAQDGQTYRLKINPWAATVREWRRSFSLVPHKLIPSIYELRLRYPDGKRGAELLNQLMASYQNYLKQEHEDVTQAQFHYLDQRKEDLYAQMAEAFTAHGRCVADYLGQTGAASAELELKQLGRLYQKLASRQLGIDVYRLPSSADRAGTQQLIERYQLQLDESEVKIRHLQRMLERLLETDLSLSAFGLLLSDPVSQHLSATAGTLIERLRDEKNYSAKEEQRLLEELELQKKLFAEHLSQLVEVEEIKRSVTQENLAGLRQVSLHGLDKEKTILTGKMEELRKEMGPLPEQVALEKQLKFKADASLAVVRAMAQMAESHTVSRHLHSISAKVLDQAIIPRAPARSHLFLFTCLGAVGALCIGATCLGLLAVARGVLPVTREKLLAMGYPFGGAISKNIESLRPIARFIQEQVIGLVAGEGPNYGRGLAELLGRSGRKVLLIEFSGPLEEISVQKTLWYDWIASGGNRAFGTEYLLSKTFLGLLEELRTQYDQILVLIRAPLGASEVQAACTWSEQMVVTVCGETIEQLTPFTSWAYHGSRSRLIFTTCDEKNS